MHCLTGILLEPNCYILVPVKKCIVDDLPEIPDTIFNYENEEENVTPIEPEATFEDANEDATHEAYDEYLTAEVLIPQGGENKKEIVKKRKRGPDGLPMGARNNNPLVYSS